jgi:hypothetical protein
MIDDPLIFPLVFHEVYLQKLKDNRRILVKKPAYVWGYKNSNLILMVNSLDTKGLHRNKFRNVSELRKISSLDVPIRRPRK